MVIAARDGVISLKEKIINATRDEREQVLDEGIQKANGEAQKKIEKAEQDSKHFFATSKQYIGSAAEGVIQIMLGSEDGSN